MLNRNSNTSISKSQLPRGRKIQNNHNVHIISKGHGHSDDQHKKSQDFQDLQVYDFKKPLKLSVNKNKENMDTNIPMKKSLVKAESVKNIQKLKKGNVTTKSIVGHKKIDSARSSLSKKAKSQTHIGLKKDMNGKKSLSPKSSRAITSRTIKPLLTQRQKTLKPKIQQKSKKVETNLNNSKNNKKKKQFIEPLLILNDSSIQIAKQLQNLHKNQIKVKKETKKITHKPEKKVIVSQAAVHKQKHQFDTERYQRDSPQIITLTHKYKNQRKPHIENQPLPYPKPRTKDTTSSKLRQKQTRAAITIQRAFRNYIQHRNIQYIQYSATLIQRWWRNLSKARHSFDLPRLVAESSLVTIHDFNQQKVHKKLEISLIDESKNQSLRERIKCLLEQNESNVESSKFIKNKRIDFSPIRDQQNDQNEENYKNLPLKIFSPKQLFDDQSEDFFQNLSNLQKAHKEKLIKNYNNQKQTIVKIWQEKLCSPRSQEGKLKDLDNRLNKQLLRFQAGIKQVLRGISMTKKEYLFEQQECPEYLNSPSSQLRVQEAKLNTSMSLEQESFTRKEIKQIQDISIQLSFTKDEPKETKYSELKFDPSLQGIEIYISGIFEFLEQNPLWKKQFFEIMNQSRGITLQIIISNLDYAQASDESTFKIPLYKHYQDEIINLITNQQAEEFNQQYLKLRQSNSTDQQQMGEFQYFHLQAVIDALNEQFHKQKIRNSLSLYSQKNRFELKQQAVLISSLNQAKEGILKNGSYICGFIDDTNELDETYLNRIKEQRLRQMLSEEMKMEIEKSDGDEEIIEMKVCLGETVVMEIFEEAIEELWRITRKR